MKYLSLGFLLLACASCAVGASGHARATFDVVPLEPMQATMRPTKDELDPKPVYACVDVNKKNNTYTVDGSGKVRA